LTDNIQLFSPQTGRGKAPHPSPEAAVVDFLLAPSTQLLFDALAAEPLDDSQLLPTLARLRRQLPAPFAAALVDQARLRRRAVAKFGAASQMFFVAEALEQATAEAPARQRAAQLDRLAPTGPLLDLGCGIGGGLLALARHRTVFAYELDPLRARFAAANVAAAGLAERVTVYPCDWTAVPLPPAAAAFVDPARRHAGRRTFDLHALQPPIEAVLRLRRQIDCLAVKVMPGVQELPTGCCVEFVSHQGTCKEAVLWFGRPDAPARWASVHRSDGWHSLANDGSRPPLGPLEPGMVLYEPDPAVIRPGALGPLCARIGGHLFAPDIAYLVAPHWHEQPFAQTFAVEEIHRFNLKVLNRRLKALQIGTVELLKRGFPQEPESLRPRLQLTPGGRSAAVILTRRGDEHWMILGQRLTAHPTGNNHDHTGRDN